jgi:hypothetical protein
MLETMSDDLPTPAHEASLAVPQSTGLESDPGGIGFDMLAASLRADASELGTFLNVLGRKLLDALPSQVTCVREKKRFRETDRIRRIEVNLEDLRFELEEASGRLVAMISHVVRGMRLKSDEVDLDEWIESLSRKLAEAAARSAKSRDAIAALLT